jgi:hypothetical protein
VSWSHPHKGNEEIKIFLSMKERKEEAIYKEGGAKRGSVWFLSGNDI